MSSNEEILKSPYDKRLYKNIWLSNEMQCLLISDSETDKSAASLIISVGMAEDPLDLPGLAHFHEHMLFLGTKKYPAQNEFSSYLTKNSSEENNAETGLNSTEFYFDCGNEGFYGALDRFAQFFIAPLFTESCTEREIQAVNSEFEMCLTDDLWKSIQLLKNLSNPDSLYNRFGCGSAETLKSDQLSLKLLEFNKRHYSSNLMKLCIYSNESLELLELWAKELFSPVPNFSLQKRDMNLSPKAFENGKNMKNFLQIIPVKDKDLIELIWIVNENLHKYYKTKPEHLIGHLFGHEGTNSLLAFLKEKNLATALSFSSEVELDSFALFIISIELTKKGFDRYEDVCEIVFCYLKKIQGKSYEDWKNLFEECSKIEELTFLYADKMKEIRYVSKMVNDMQLYPVKNIIDGGYRMENFDFELIMRILKNFTIDNLIIFFSSKNFQFKTNNIEKYFKTQYNCHEINEEIKQKFINPKMDMFDCKKILDFPLKNIFIPQFFSIIPDEKIWDQPKKIHESEFSTLWLKQGSSFKLPKVVIELKIYTDGLCFQNNAKDFICADIWLEILKYQINEVNYMAEMAKIFSQISLESNGVNLVVKGFSDSSLKYTSEIIKNLFNISQEAREKFPTYLESKLLEYTNFFNSQPFKITKYISFALIIKNGIYSDPKILLDTIKTLTISDFELFEKTWLSKIFLEWFINGNIEETQAFELINDCENYLKSLKFPKIITPLPKNEINQVSSAKLEPLKQYLYEMKISSFSKKEEKNSAVKVFWQSDKTTPELKLIFMIIDKILLDPCFDRLRTDQQLGYVVFSKDEILRGVSGFGITIMSCLYSSQYVVKKIEEFMKEMEEEIRKMDKEEFEEIIESVLVEVTAKHNNLYEESDYFLQEIRSHEYLFNRKEIEEELLENINLEDIINAYEKIFFKEARKLEIHVISDNLCEDNQKMKIDRMQKEMNIIEIKSINNWKMQADSHQDYYALK